MALSLKILRSWHFQNSKVFLSFFFFYPLTFNTPIFLTSMFIPCPTCEGHSIIAGCHFCRIRIRRSHRCGRSQRFQSCHHFNFDHHSLFVQPFQIRHSYKCQYRRCFICCHFHSIKVELRQYSVLFSVKRWFIDNCFLK